MSLESRWTGAGRVKGWCWEIDGWSSSPPGGAGKQRKQPTITLHSNPHLNSLKQLSSHTCTHPHPNTPVSLTSPLLASLDSSGGSPSIFRICGCSELVLDIPGPILLPLGGMGNGNWSPLGGIGNGNWSPQGGIGNGNWSFMAADGRVCSSTGWGNASLLSTEDGQGGRVAPRNSTAHSFYTRHSFYHQVLPSSDQESAPHP